MANNNSSKHNLPLPAPGNSNDLLRHRPRSKSNILIRPPPPVAPNTKVSLSPGLDHNAQQPKFPLLRRLPPLPSEDTLPPRSSSVRFKLRADSSFTAHKRFDSYQAPKIPTVLLHSAFNTQNAATKVSAANTRDGNHVTKMQSEADSNAFLSKSPTEKRHEHVGPYYISSPMPSESGRTSLFNWSALSFVDGHIPVLEEKSSISADSILSKLGFIPTPKTEEYEQFLYKARRLCRHVQETGEMKLNAIPASFSDDPPPQWLPQKFVVTYLTGADRNNSTVCTVYTGKDSAFTFIQKVLSLKPDQASSYIVRIVGTSEYLMDENRPLSTFTYVLECLKHRRTPEFTITMKLPLQNDIENYFKAKQAPPVPSILDQPFLGMPTTSRRCYSITHLDKPLEFRVLCVDNLEFDHLVAFYVSPSDATFLNHKMLYSKMKNLTYSGIKVYVDIQIVYAGKVYDSITTHEASAPVWPQWLKTSVLLSNIPRETRICFNVCAKKGRRIVPLGWVAFNLFDCNGYLRSGKRILHMWPGAAHLTGTTAENHLQNGLALHLEIEDCGVPIVYDRTYGRSVRARALQLDLPEGQALERVTRLFKSNPLYTLTEEDRKLVWQYRYFGAVAGMPYSIVRVAQSANWFDPTHVSEIHYLLSRWPKIEPLEALELLDAGYADQRLRSYAVSCLRSVSDTQLIDMLMQLVQALTFEPWHDSDLSRFLLERALRNRQQVGHFLYWHLVAGTTHKTAARFSAIAEAYLSNCGGHLDTLMAMYSGVSVLRELCKGAAKLDTPAKRLAYLQAVNPTFNKPFCSPLNPAISASKLILDKCKFMDSAAMPLWATFENSDSLGQPFSIIFKLGDDLRQDMLTLQILRIMDQFWKKDGLDLQMSVYGCISTGQAEGMIEVVPNATTTGRIQKEYSGATGAFKKEPLATWLQQQNPNAQEYQDAVERFTHSCAGYCVGSYVLGLGDRHNDNIMVTKSGLLFHIDFAHILGNIMRFGAYKRETAPFVLTPEFAYVMGDVEGANYKKFTQLCCRGYNIVRRNAHSIIRLFKLMLQADLPQLKSVQSLQYLHTAFSLDLGHEEAAEKFKCLIDEAVSNWTTQINFFFHNLAHPLPPK